VPFADLANHSFTHNATFQVGQGRQSFELRSVVEIQAGEEAAISYGGWEGALWCSGWRLAQAERIHGGMRPCKSSA